MTDKYQFMMTKDNFIDTEYNNRLVLIDVDRYTQARNYKGDDNRERFIIAHLPDSEFGLMYETLSINNVSLNSITEFIKTYFHKNYRIHKAVITLEYQLNGLKIKNSIEFSLSSFDVTNLDKAIDYFNKLIVTVKDINKPTVFIEF